MKTQTISQKLIFLILVMGGVSVLAAPFDAYKPTWKIGQKWQIEVSGKTQPKSTRKDKLHFVPRWGTLTYGYIIEKVTQIDGEPCWCIRIDLLKSDKEFIGVIPCYRVYYKKSDSTLKRVESLGEKGEHFIAADTYSGGPAIADSWTESMPMAFPYFSSCSSKYSPKPYIRGDGTKRYNIYEAYQTAHIIVKNMRGKNVSVFSVYIKERDDVKKQEGLASLQIWEKGMPWWSEVIETKNGIFRYKARLVSINGKRLENLPEWDLKSASISPSATKK